jgi:hypothetical protein
VGRWLFFLLSIASLVLSIAAAVLWTRSGGAPEVWRLERYRRYEVVASLQTVQFVVTSKSIGGSATNMRGATPFRSDWKYEHRLTMRVLRVSESDFGRVGHQTVNVGTTYEMDADGTTPKWTQQSAEVWFAPYWGAVTIFLVLPALAVIFEIVRRKIARSRRDRTLCEHCGYDLRATPDRCPECGAVPRAAAATVAA